MRAAVCAEYTSVSAHSFRCELPSLRRECMAVMHPEPERSYNMNVQVGLIGTEAALLGPAEDDSVEAARENFALQRAELEGAVMTSRLMTLRPGITDGSATGECCTPHVRLGFASTRLACHVYNLCLQHAFGFMQGCVLRHWTSGGRWAWHGSTRPAARGAPPAAPCRETRPSRTSASARCAWYHGWARS